MIRFPRFGLLLLLFGGAALLVRALPAAASPPVFTGNVETDFVVPGAVTMFDRGGVPDVGFPPDFPPGTPVGFEILDVRLFYDREADVLSVGLNFLGIAGDADGDGDPGRTGPILGGLGGTDFPSFGGTESFVVEFDTDSDGITDVVAGVGALFDITEFQVALAVMGPVPSLAFGDPLPQNTGPLFMDPDAAHPDIEFTILRFSELPGFPPLDRFRESLQFRVGAFSGALKDVIGEDRVFPHENVFGKIGFDLELRDGDLVTDQFLPEGLIISGGSRCGLPGVFINDPRDNPSTDDIIPDTSPFFITTQCVPGDDSSDSGEMDFRFISPLDLTSPVGAVFMGLTFLDIEDSGTPGRGTSRFLLFAREDGALVADIPIPSGPNGNQFPVIFPTFGLRGDFFPPIGEAKAVVGDDDDSGGLDSLCYNLEPCILDLRLEVGSPGEAIRPGERVALPLFIESIADRRSEVIASVTVRRQGGRRERVLAPPKLIRLRPRFDNLEDPKRLVFTVPERVGPRVGRRPLELSAKLVHPTSGVILAQAVVELPLTVD